MSKRSFRLRPIARSEPFPPELTANIKEAVKEIGRVDTHASDAKRRAISAILDSLPPRVLDQIVLVIGDESERVTTDRVLPLPPVAPECWEDRDLGQPQRGSQYENPVRFARRVYARWIAAGVLSNEALYLLDPSLFKAVRQWAERHPDDTIPGLKLRLPSLEERIARISPATSRDELIRLGYALNQEKRRLARTRDRAAI